MLIVGAFGGLASQMNQYAFVLWLRKRFPNVAVKLVDGCEWMKDYGHYGYELERVFGISADRVEWSRIKRLANFYPGYGLKAKMWNAAYQLRDRLWGSRRSQITIQDLKSADEGLFQSLDVSMDWLFWGNANDWVLDALSDDLREKFLFPALDAKNEQLAAQMEQVNSVAVHVRRGDYVKFGYPLLDGAYYKRSFAQIETQVANPVYFVFSDDQSAAVQMLGTAENIVYVQTNRGESSYRDMQLMSLCKHNIVANSGFSRMAARLNANPGKIVIDHGDAL